MDPPRERGESEIFWTVSSVRGIDETTGNQNLSHNYTAPFSRTAVVRIPKGGAGYSKDSWERESLRSIT
ncbi:protein of unknown function [Nitrospira defluvii]|uniref:Uncharacterized protein n=1 Tax=Nitrospira defluvii TaxID=330214 RepID=D8PF36_9BACT|nr:protein of unknown function [Nitrospira defluvii]